MSLDLCGKSVCGPKFITAIIVTGRGIYGGGRNKTFICLKNPFRNGLGGLIQPPVDLNPSVLGRILGLPAQSPTPFGIPLNAFARHTTETPPTSGLGLLGGLDTAGPMSANLFRAQADRRQRILNLMRHTPRNFLPRRLLLRSKQLGRVFKH